MKTHLICMLGVMLLLSTTSAAQKTDPSSLGAFSSNELVRAAWATSVDFGKGSNRNADGTIPSEYWAEPIKALNPIKVYGHKVNIVVVLRMQDGIEEGKYICIPISSYLPTNGDDGFEFVSKPNRKSYLDEVIDFKRKKLIGH
jgi:hypothetical protein